MSKANETNQTKPDFKIDGCGDCPVYRLCRMIDETKRDGCYCEIKEKIEGLVNGKR